MKKITLYTLSLAAIMSISCAKEEAPEVVCGNPVVFEAAIGDADSKAILTEGASSSKVSWEAGDQVSLWAESKMYQYKADKSAAVSTLSPMAGSSLADEYFALYPYDATATLASGVITTTLPSVQTAKLGSFSHHLAVSYSTSLSLGFKNVCGLFRIDITEPAVTKIEFKGNANETVAGEIAITVGDKPTWSAVSGAKTVTLSAGEGKFLQTGAYYLAILPQDFNSGVTVTTYYNDNTTYVKTVTEKVSLVPSGAIAATIASGQWKYEELLSLGGYAPQDLVRDADGNFIYTTRATVHGIWKYEVASNTKTPIAVYSNTSTTDYPNEHNAALSGQAPWGIALDSKGTIYYAAKAKGKLMTCTGKAAVSEYIVKETADATSGMSLPNIMKIAFDAADNMYVLVRGSSAGLGFVLKVKNNVVLKRWDLTQYLYEFMCISYDKTKLFLFPNSSGLIQMIDLTTGTMTKVAGNGTQHTAAASYSDGVPGNPFTASLGQCEGAVCDANGTIYFTDAAKGKTIRMFTPDANGDYSKGTIRTILGTPYSNAVLPYPNGIELAADGKTFYYLENGGKIRKVSYVR